MRPNLSLGDTIAGLHTALGIVMACLYQARNPGAHGQVIDTALYEASFNLLEGVVPEYDGAGVIREPSGSTITGIVPTNTYRCADGKFIVIGANGDSIFNRLCLAMGRQDMADNPALKHNRGRVEHETEIDAAIEDWTRSLNAEDALRVLEEARVPSGPIYNVADMMSDPHFNARGLFEEVDVNGSPLRIPAMIPKFSETPGRTDWAGAEVGAHNREVYCGLLGMAESELEALREQGVV